MKFTLRKGQRGLGRMGMLLITPVLVMSATVTSSAIAPAPPASAHWLSAHRADQRAAHEAYRYADVGEYYGTYTDGCQRLTRHKQKCIIWAYGEETGRYCDAYTNVRFRNSRSYRTTDSGWYQGDCFVVDTSAPPPTPPPAEAPAPPPQTQVPWPWIWDGPLTKWPTVVF
jgi:hypothetical protein